MIMINFCASSTTYTLQIQYDIIFNHDALQEQITYRNQDNFSQVRTTAGFHSTETNMNTKHTTTTLNMFSWSMVFKANLYRQNLISGKITMVGVKYWNSCKCMH